jgi:hypothetical protein
MARYVVKKDWTLLKSQELTNLNGEVVGQVKTFEGSLVDQHANEVLDSAALQVKIKAGNISKVKTFKGETMHMDANRFVSDFTAKL